MRMPPLNALVLVRWNDASFHFDESDSEEAVEVYDAVSVGWVKRVSRSNIWIATERLRGTSWRGITRIPRALVLSVRIIERRGP